MQTVRTSEELTRAVAQLKRRGTLALVPTMGALHRGHLALIEEAQRRTDAVAVSVFVNPLQFGPNEDLARYPRREEEDAQVLADAGCDLVWLPAADQFYPQDFATAVRVAGLSERWEGEARPGHFEGVATVVAKLLLAVHPDLAVFGEKDFQQLAVVRRMVADLGLGVDIAAVPTVRDADGLALSSRNAFLSADERKQALALPSSLEAARDAIGSGRPVAEALDEARKSIHNAGFSRIDYVALVNAHTLEPLPRPEGEMRLIAAAVIGTTRLIDNIPA